MNAFTRDTVHALTATLTAGERPVAVNLVFTMDDRYVSDSVAVDHDGVVRSRPGGPGTQVATLAPWM